MTTESNVNNTVAKLRFLCGTGDNYPVSSSVTNADVMVLIEAIDHLDRDVDNALTLAEQATTAMEEWKHRAQVIP